MSRCYQVVILPVLLGISLVTSGCEMMDVGGTDERPGNSSATSTAGTEQSDVATALLGTYMGDEEVIEIDTRASTTVKEGGACSSSNKCAYGLACVSVRRKSTGATIGSYCMTQCSNAGSADSACNGGESCVNSHKGPVCFNGKNPSQGYTSPNSSGSAGSGSSDSGSSGSGSSGSGSSGSGSSGSGSSGSGSSGSGSSGSGSSGSGNWWDWWNNGSSGSGSSGSGSSGSGSSGSGSSGCGSSGSSGSSGGG